MLLVSFVQTDLARMLPRSKSASTLSDMASAAARSA